MTPTPPNLAQSIAQEITAEVGNALEPEDRKRFCEHIEKHIIQPRVELMEKVAENARYLLEAFDGDNETVEYFARNALRQALSKL